VELRSSSRTRDYISCTSPPSNSFLTLSELSSISRGQQPRCSSRAPSPDSSTAARAWLEALVMCVVGPGILAAGSASHSSHLRPPPPPPPWPSATLHLSGAHFIGASICRGSGSCEMWRRRDLRPRADPVPKRP
jgi:hypothetical protein